MVTGTWSTWTNHVANTFTMGTNTVNIGECAEIKYKNNQMKTMNIGYTATTAAADIKDVS